jgi:hypothetical protein
MSHRVFDELLHGRGAHADPVACIEDLSPELTARTIKGFPHSIWQLVSHVNYWMDYDIKRIGDEAPRYPEHAALSWLAEAAPPSEKHRSDAKVTFSALLQIIESCAIATGCLGARSKTHTSRAHEDRFFPAVRSVANVSSQQLSHRTNRRDPPLLRCLASSRWWRYLVTSSRFAP